MCVCVCASFKHRAQFTDATGRGRTQADVDSSLPAGWEWLTPWSVDASGGVGTDGWDYDVDFPLFASRGRTPNASPSMLHSVRRRRLTRVRRRVEAAAATRAVTGPLPWPLLCVCVRVGQPVSACLLLWQDSAAHSRRTRLRH